MPKIDASSTAARGSSKHLPSRPCGFHSRHPLNWVDLYDGDQPGVRVQPRDPADWVRMDRELTEAAATLEAEGWTSTLVRGAMRQATFFRVGTALPAVRQHTLRYLQGGQLWSTNRPKTPVPAPQVQHTRLDLGSDLAVAVGVAVDPTDAVTAYLRSQAIPVSELVTVQPAAGADDQAVANAGRAVAYAQQIRNLVRQGLDRAADTERVHLFLAGPGGLALLLGHRWNRIRPTVVYEHLGPGRGYTPAFSVNA
ncbi:SAVED domain-containing protein [Geodermatophilus sp. SYSU D00779]